MRKRLFIISISILTSILIFIVCFELGLAKYNKFKKTINMCSGDNNTQNINKLINFHLDENIPVFITDEDINKYIIKANTDTNKNKLYSGNDIYDELSSIAKKQVKEDKLLFSVGSKNIGTVFNINEIVDLIANNEAYFVDSSKKTNVPIEMIKAIIFREMLCLSIDDVFFDNVKLNGTVGIAQIGVQKVKANEIFLNEDKKCSYSDKKIKSMLNSTEGSIYFAARQLQAKIKSEGFKIDAMQQKDIEKIFGGYNGNVPISIFGVVTYSQGAEKYGKQTFEYYEAFKKYHNGR